MENKTSDSPYCIKFALICVMLSVNLLFNCSYIAAASNENQTGTEKNITEVPAAEASDTLSAIGAYPPVTCDEFDYEGAAKSLMPAGDARLMSDEALVSEVRKLLGRMYDLNILLVGYECPLSGNEPVEGDYWEVDPSYAADKETLLKMYYDTFTEKYLASMKKDLETCLFGGNQPIFKMCDGKLLVLQTYFGVPIYYYVDTAVITECSGSILKTAVYGNDAGGDSHMQTVTLKRVGDKLYADSAETKNLYGELVLYLPALSKNAGLLTDIFGFPEYVMIGKGNEKVHSMTLNGVVTYYEVKSTMSISQMKELLYSLFTEDIARYYCEIYIDKVYYEKNGKLYVSSYATPADFGSYDFDSFKWLVLSISGVGCDYNIVSIDWYYEGHVKKVNISCKQVGRVWKISSRLPLLG